METVGMKYDEVRVQWNVKMTVSQEMVWNVMLVYSYQLHYNIPTHTNSYSYHLATTAPRFEVRGVSMSGHDGQEIAGSLFVTL